MSVLLRHWSKWSGWYLFLASVSAWLYLLALIFREGVGLSEKVKPT